jgi:hypothetical protein
MDHEHVSLFLSKPQRKCPIAPMMKRIALKLLFICFKAQTPLINKMILVLPSFENIRHIILVCVNILVVSMWLCLGKSIIQRTLKAKKEIGKKTLNAG